MTFPPELHNLHAGQSVYIIGKGKSLRYLQRRHIGHGVVIAINQAILAVESLGIPNPIYSMQKDGESMIQPADTTTLLLQKGYSDLYYYDHPMRFVLDTEPTQMSVIDCIDLAEWMGCNRFVFIAFDSLTHDDYETYNVWIKQASLTDAGLNYEKNKAVILDRIHRLNYEFVTPEPVGVAPKFVGVDKNK